MITVEDDGNAGNDTQTKSFENFSGYKASSGVLLRACEKGHFMWCKGVTTMELNDIADDEATLDITAIITVME